MKRDDALTVWKMIYLARRNPALAAEDFPQAWREHSALGRQCKNVGQRVKAVAQCSRMLNVQGLDASAALSQDYDGVNLMVLADREAGSVIWSDPETLAVMRPDEPRVFADYVRNFSLLVRQQLLFSRLPQQDFSQQVLPQKEQVMLIGFLQRSEDRQGKAAELSACPPQWQAGGLGQAGRIVCNLLDEEAPAGYGFRYVVEWWFDTPQQAIAAAQGLRTDAADCAGEWGWGEHVFMLTEVTHARP